MSLLLENERNQTVTVEDVQDLAEQALMAQGYHRIARNYILYRELHSKKRQEKVLEQVKEKSLTVKVSETETVIYDPSIIEEHLRRLSHELYKISLSEPWKKIPKRHLKNKYVFCFSK